MIKDAIREADGKMKNSIQSMEEDFTRIRTGRATPALIEKLSVEYYGIPTPLQQLATISVPEARQLMIKPFDVGSFKDIEKAILTSDIGLTPNNDGKAIRLNLPPLTEERRRDLVKVVSARLEDGRISVRNIRRDSIKDMREFEQEKMISEDELERGEKEIQELTLKNIEIMEGISSQKEKEIMEV